MAARAADGLEGFCEQVRQKLTGAKVAGFDETGFRAGAQLHWVHCARTGKYTLVVCHPHRGTKAMNATGVLPAFRGVAVHDAWAPYDTYTGAAHQLCGAHYAETVVMPIPAVAALWVGVSGSGMSA
jgi:hypothetical protein